MLLQHRPSGAEIDAQVRQATRPLYELDVDLLERLAPDVVVSQSLCDVCAVPSGDVEAAIRSLSARPHLVDLAPATLREVPGCFAAVGAAIDRQDEADRLLVQWQKTLERYHDRFAGNRVRVAFLDWLDPPYAAGHWVPDLIEWLGAQSVLASSGEPSREVTWAQVVDSAPDLVVAACCGFTAPRASAEATPGGLPIVRLDGYELFSRPSPRLLESLQELAKVVDSWTQAGDFVIPGG